MKATDQAIIDLLSSDKITPEMCPRDDDDIPDVSDEIQNKVEEIQDGVAEWATKSSTASRLDVLLALRDRRRQLLLMQMMAYAFYCEGSDPEGEYAYTDEAVEDFLETAFTAVLNTPAGKAFCNNINRTLAEIQKRGNRKRRREAFKNSASVPPAD